MIVMPFFILWIMVRLSHESDLCRLQFNRPIPGTFFDHETSYALGAAGGHGMDRNDKKGGMEMNTPEVYALGLLHGGLLLAFVWMAWPRSKRK